MVIANTERTYIPAAGRNWRLPLYDPITKLLGVDRTRRRLVAQAELTRGQRVLEVGCGTGSLLIEMGRQPPAVELCREAGFEAQAGARRGRRLTLT